MKYFKLPNTDLTVSNIALGMMRIAQLPQEKVNELILEALDLGINFFDHADIYAGGKSEELFGEFLKEHPALREKMIIQTKCGIVPSKCYNLDYDYIMGQVDKSLERLQTNYLDILVLHRPDVLLDPREVARAFTDLYNSGKVHYFGVSNMNPMQIELIQKYTEHKIIVNQMQLSIVHSVMLDQAINVNMTNDASINRDGSVIDYCNLKDITLQAWSILQASWEDGTFLDNPKYPELNKRLAELANKYHTTKSVIATSWVLRLPLNVQAITGTTNVKHLSEVVSASELSLTREEWYYLYLANKMLP